MDCVHFVAAWKTHTIPANQPASPPYQFNRLHSSHAAHGEYCISSEKSPVFVLLLSLLLLLLKCILSEKKRERSLVHLRRSYWYFVYDIAVFIVQYHIAPCAHTHTDRHSVFFDEFVWLDWVRMCTRSFNFYTWPIITSVSHLYIPFHSLSVVAVD